MTRYEVREWIQDPSLDRDVNERERVFPYRVWDKVLKREAPFAHFRSRQEADEWIQRTIRLMEER